MKALLTETIGKLSAHLGRCPRCMRQSFRFMLGAWSLAFVVSLITNAGMVLVASQITAAGSAILWLSHLAVFSLRAARNASTPADNASGRTVSADPSVDPQRRYVLAFTKSLVVAATATALPLRAAFAQSCGCAAPLKCCFNYTGDQYVCAPRDAVCCASANPYYCSSGTNCYGERGCR